MLISVNDFYQQYWRMSSLILVLTWSVVIFVIRRIILATFDSVTNCEESLSWEWLQHHGICASTHLHCIVSANIRFESNKPLRLILQLIYSSQFNSTQPNPTPNENCWKQEKLKISSPNFLRQLAKSTPGSRNRIISDQSALRIQLSQGPVILPGVIFTVCLESIEHFVGFQ